MELVNDEFFQRPPLPVAVGPGERGVDHCRRAVNACGLEAGGRVGEGPLAIDAIAIPFARRHSRNEALEIAVGLALERIIAGGWARSFADDGERADVRGPVAEIRPRRV